MTFVRAVKRCGQRCRCIVCDDDRGHRSRDAPGQPDGMGSRRPVRRVRGPARGSGAFDERLGPAPALAPPHHRRGRRFAPGVARARSMAVRLWRGRARDARARRHAAPTRRRAPPGGERGRGRRARERRRPARARVAQPGELAHRAARGGGGTDRRRGGSRCRGRAALARARGTRRHPRRDPDGGLGPLAHLRRCRRVLPAVARGRRHRGAARRTSSTAPPADCPRPR